MALFNSGAFGGGDNHDCLEHMWNPCLFEYYSPFLPFVPLPLFTVRVSLQPDSADSLFFCPLWVESKSKMAIWLFGTKINHKWDDTVLNWNFSHTWLPQAKPMASFMEAWFYLIFWGIFNKINLNKNILVFCKFHRKMEF